MKKKLVSFMCAVMAALCLVVSIPARLCRTGRRSSTAIYWNIADFCQLAL